MDNGGISIVFAGLAQLGAHVGVSGIHEMPACWEFQIDEQWFFALNGHEDERQCSKGHRVPPYNAYLEYNGWPAGIIDPFGGLIAAGAAANEDALIAAIEKRLGRKIGAAA
jgi:hypothetical protein